MAAPVVPAVAQVLGAEEDLAEERGPVEVRLAVVEECNAAAACNAAVVTSAAATSVVAVLELNAVDSDKVFRPHPAVQAPETHIRMLVRVLSVMPVPGESITMPRGVAQAAPPAVSDYAPVRGQAQPELGSRGPVLQEREVPPVVSVFAPVQVRAPQVLEVRRVASAFDRVLVQAPREPVSLTPVVQEVPPAELVCVPVPEQAPQAWAVPPVVSVFVRAQVPVRPELVSAGRESADLPVESAICLERVPARPEPPVLTSTRTPLWRPKRLQSERQPIRPTVLLSMRATPTPGTLTTGRTVRSTTIQVTEPLPRQSDCPAHRCCMTTARTSCISRETST